MRTDGIQGVTQFLVILHVLHEIHFLIAPIAESVQHHVPEAAFVHGFPQVFGEVGIPSLLVVAA